MDAVDTVAPIAVRYHSRTLTDVATRRGVYLEQGSLPFQTYTSVHTTDVHSGAPTRAGWRIGLSVGMRLSHHFR